MQPGFVGATTEDVERFRWYSDRWSEMGPTRRAEVLGRFPQLAHMGLRLDAPGDEELMREDEESAQYCRMIDGGANPPNVTGAEE